ncbi:MAG: carboxypeptidase regulatory-like domain-containing protein, partial [Saccharothrix sp.]|nr:carboxypeptidase regulatory-like domain-containing protein [Saccharothrix sp.]
ERPHVEAAPAQRADLKVAIAFDRAEYPPDADIGLTVTVRNAGAVPAVDVRFTHYGDLWLTAGAAELDRIPGATIAAGGSKSYRVVGRLRTLPYDRVEYTVTAHTGAQTVPDMDPTPEDNTARASTAVPVSWGAAVGVLYRDADGDGRFDEGEGIADSAVYATGGAPTTWLSGYTDATGRFSLEAFESDVPTGHYRVYLSVRDNPYVIAPGHTGFTVEAGRTTVLELPVAPPVLEVLRAHVEFDRDTYRPTDPVGIEVTLANTGAAPLTGVVAVCDEHPEEGRLTGRGPAWAALSPDGPGITLAAGETKVLTITEAVPEDAAVARRIGVACDFGNSGRGTEGYVGSSDFAEVGTFGAVEGTLEHAGDGQPLDGARLVALDQRTRLPIAEAVSHDGGAFTFARLPAGRTRVLVLGEYRDEATGDGWFTVDVVADATTQVRFVVAPGPAVGEPAPVDRLEVTASFDKTSYDISEPVTARIKVTNVGAGSRSEVRYEPEWVPSTMVHDFAQWGLLYQPAGPRLRLWPGESYEVTVVGEPVTWIGDLVSLKGRFVHGVGGASVPLHLSAAVGYGKGDVTVLVYGDADADGAFDDGEALPGILVTVEGGVPTAFHEGDTDLSGRYRVAATPAGNYRVRTWHASNWALPVDFYDRLTLAAGGAEVFEVGLVRPADALTAVIAWDKPAYRPDEQPRLNVTIVNNTRTDVTVHAVCGGGPPYQVENGPEWGPLAESGEGVPIAARRSWSTTVVETMPDAAPDHGLITATCAFGTRDADGEFHEVVPGARATAKVPGAVWTTTGRVVRCCAAPNAQVVLLDPDTNRPVARATADADGAFTVPDLAVGHYTPVVLGPWQVVRITPEGPLFAAVRGDASPRLIAVEPGPVARDPDAGTARPP